ncbi:MAG: regulatory protein RecX [Coriobacteriales bacterium]|nr:regulatory protein RecX [Coriobacteriales bacterium]
MYGAYPQGSVRLFSEDGVEEYVSVPASVARALARHAREQGLKDPVQDYALPQPRVEILRLIDRATTGTAKERVLNLLEHRDYCQKELSERLVTEGFSRKLASMVVQRASEAGIVSDERFAQAFVRSKLAAGWGVSRIERSLSNKGIAAEELEGWPYDYFDPEDELQRALEVAERKTVREPNAFQKMVRFLMGRGFSYRVSKDAAQRVLESKEDFAI